LVHSAPLLKIDFVVVLHAEFYGGSIKQL
jgi:hypothetical protein